MTTQKENLGPLKFLVISMGLILIGGFVFLVSILVGKAGDVMGHKGKCAAEATVDLTPFGQPATTVWKDNVLSVMVVDPEKENSYRLITVDTCTGKIATNVEVKTLTPFKPTQNDAVSPQ
ncbi:MAG: hypothetical protein U1E36_06470 [Rickettsiales bacterium]